MRRTKIVATLGPATDDDAVLDRLIAAGLDCARLNCSHAGPGDLARRVAAVRQAETRAGRPVAILADLQGPKIRLGPHVGARHLNVDEIVRFSGPQSAPDPQTLEVIFSGFLDLVSTRSEIVIGDGIPRCIVEGYEDGDLLARVVVPGPIGPRKGVTVTYARVQQPAITAKDAHDLVLAAQLDVDFVALSFVRSAGDILELRRRLAELDCPARVIAKIEKVEAYEQLDEIVAVADGVMVARGDYGVEAGVARVPLMQKATIAAAAREGKLVITATQMLESMILAPMPTRAEATDVANAVLDGTSAVMLSAETASGNYPLEAVAMMDEIIVEAERGEMLIRASGHRAENPDESIMRAAVTLAQATGAAALVVPTFSGGTARTCAQWRPRQPILALTHSDRVTRQLQLDWGVTPLQVEETSSTDALIEQALIVARERGGVVSGQRVVVTAGASVGRSGATNLITLREIP
jgi:pyruvate kinase